MRRVLVVALLVVVGACTDSGSAVREVPTPPTPTEATAPATRTTTEAPASESQPDVPDGYSLLDASHYGFTMAVPDEWFVVDLGIQTWKDDARTYAPGIAESYLSSIEEAAADPTRPIVLWMVPLPDGTNMLASISQFEEGLTVEVYQDLLAQATSDNGGETLVLDRVSMSGFEAAREIARVPRFGINTETHTYILLTPSTVFRFFFTTGFPASETMVNHFATVMDSFALTDAD